MRTYTIQITAATSLDLRRTLEQVQKLILSGALFGVSPEPPRSFDFRASGEFEPQEILDKLIFEAGFGIRIRKACLRHNVRTVGELCGLTADQLLNQRNFGPTSLQEVREKLAKYGLSLRGDA